MNITGRRERNNVSVHRLLVDNCVSINSMAELSPVEKIKLIEKKFRDIMAILGLDIENDSLKDTPGRVAKMFVNETFSGLLPENEPRITLFENEYNYSEMLIERNIPVYSTCEHHFVPIIGKAHIGYIATGKVVGLSKLNRIVNYFSRRPQVQERLTVQIADYLKEALGTENVAIVMEAEHLCVTSRGVRDAGSSTITKSYHGLFLNTDRRNEFDQQIRH